MTEMDKLIMGLDLYDIPHVVVIQPFFNTKQVWYPSKEEAVCDAICHRCSYGGNEGLLEICGLTNVEDDDVEGWLTAIEVLSRIYNHWKENSDCC